MDSKLYFHIQSVYPVSLFKMSYLALKLSDIVPIFKMRMTAEYTNLSRTRRDFLNAPTVLLLRFQLNSSVFYSACGHLLLLVHWSRKEAPGFSSWCSVKPL